MGGGFRSSRRVKPLLKICMLTPEYAPFAKVGGLGDCVASLSHYIAQLGHEVKVILPKYATFSLPQSIIEHPQPMIVNMGYGVEFAKVWELKEANLSVYFLEFDRYFNRNGIYADLNGDFGDNHERFSFLARAAIDLCYYLNWMPDIFHGHDWTAGLLPVLLDTVERGRPLEHSGSVFTIHNLQHHGYAPRSVLSFLGIPEHVFRPDGVEAFGQVNMMKAGLYFSTKLTTVSENYAREIQTPNFGFGLDPVLKFRAGDLIGIRNGIDEALWSPENDPFLTHHFSKNNFAGKAHCKAELQHYCRLPEDPTIPIFAVVSRLYEQKGLDYLARILENVLGQMRLQFILLGSGDHELESQFIHIARHHQDQAFIYMGYNEPLAHLIEAGSDFFVMPSRFEPCGLNQMYSMRYGTLPIAHATGGLADTIISGENGTGLLFHDLTESALFNAIGWANALYYDRPDVCLQMRKRAMEQDFSWKTSAEHYVDVYHWAQKVPC